MGKFFSTMDGKVMDARLAGGLEDLCQAMIPKTVEATGSGKECLGLIWKSPQREGDQSRRKVVA